MRELAMSEILSLRELLQMETNVLAAAKATAMMVQDPQLKAVTDAGVLATETRIKGLQQFIDENQITTIGEVH